MKKLFFAGLLTLALAVPLQAMATVNISVGIALPPPVVFAAPPEVVVLPDTPDVYVVPTIDVDIYFWNGWWWRFWEGRWYRSSYYDRGWAYYGYVPRFYYDVDPGWRTYYRDRNWYGHRWNYQRIPYGQLRKNWKRWHEGRHWERRGTWGVQDYRPRPNRDREDMRRQREREYRNRPEVQRHEQWKEERRRGGPGARQPERHREQEQRREHQPGEQHRRGEPERERHQGGHEGESRGGHDDGSQGRHGGDRGGERGGGPGGGDMERGR